MPAQKNPGNRRGRAFAWGQYARQVYRQPSKPDNWRERLPSPESYYGAAIEKLGRPNAASWAQGVCPFHEDRQASLSANLAHGGWRCFAGCGQGDLVSFHMRRTGLQFADAVRDLTGGRP